ncbi:MAG: SpoIID/LytB domain-containing protein [FCB group bacterium]|nr:SpoIID/LytB domain-containing protein [FCB group bacterium]
MITFGLLLFAIACRHATVSIPPVPERPQTPVETSAPTPEPEATAEFQSVATETLQIRLIAGLRQVTLTGPMEVSANGARQQWAAGTHTLTLSGSAPATRRFHLFAKTFPMDQVNAAQAYCDSWKRQGYPALVIPLGKRFRTREGQYLDNRLQYISLTQFSTRAQAAAEKTRLEGLGQWTWIEEQMLAPGAGQLAKGGAAYPTPLEVRGQGPIALAAGGKTNRYSGTLLLRVGADGLIEVCEVIPLEEYLAGVLPAEMPALWPIEALKAQAMSARSEVLANLGVKHKMEGFHYCAGEHCRAYNGFGGRHANSDAAVRATAGFVLSNGARVVPTVFSACCGGWSEDNDTVWSSPPDAALRAVGDFPRGANPAPNGPVGYGLAKWLSQPPSALCGADAANFRWTKRHSAAALTQMVNRIHKVGAVREIRLGERGPGGRLKSVDIVGTQGTVTVRKELAIRQIFGGLPSAMFILDVERGAKGPVEFVFRGGGRGHGVGLCQQGARGMAVRGWTCADILAHYFSGTVTVGLE